MENAKLDLLGHLGIVAAVIEEIKLVEEIDALLPLKKNNHPKLSMGERVKSMILNGLGFSDSRLYMFSTFLKRYSVNRLFNENIKAEMFNDDSLGRCLDAIYEFGPTKFFFLIASKILTVKKLMGKTIHIDTTSLAVFGKYAEGEEESLPYNGDPSQGAIPAHGYSKDGKPQFKQMVLSLATTGAGGFPLYMESHSGNVSDKKELLAGSLRMKGFLKDVSEAEMPLVVGDSAIYEAGMQNSNSLKILSRVPENHKKVKEILQEHKTDSPGWFDLGKGYKQIIKILDYKGVVQKWAIIFSEQAFKREMHTFLSRVEADKQSTEKRLWHLSNERFGSEEEAKKAFKKFSQKNKYHYVQHSIEPIRKYAGLGRPGAGEEKITVGYQVQGTVKVDQIKIDKSMETKGKFILATNELDEKKLANEDILKTYKEQAKTEKGFAFIKNNAFEVSSVFLKKPSRIAALMVIMTLCLMVYGLAGFFFKQKLEEKDETIPDQLKRPTKKPSMQFVFTHFAGVHVFFQQINGSINEVVTNLGPLIRKIIEMFGDAAMRIYGLSTTTAPP